MLDRGGHDGLVDQRAGPQRRTADAQAPLHDGEQVDLGACPAADADDRDAPGERPWRRAPRGGWPPRPVRGRRRRARDRAPRRGRRPRAPRVATASRSWAWRTEATQRAPVAAASCTPALPTPPAAPVTRTRSPDAEPALGEQRVVGGGERLGEAARLGPGQSVGTAMAAALVDDGELGLRAAAHDGHDAIADGEARRPPARGDDLAGELHARGCRAVSPAGAG